MTLLVLAVFVLVYAGMALGRFPGLQVDRTGISLLGAIALLLGGAVDSAGVVRAIDFPTLFILLGLMLLSAQFALAGFYDWCALRIARAARGPEALLGLTVLVAGVLSAVLANDVVVFAMTPMLCAGLKGRGLDPRPYLIALAGAANAGSAATLIGNANFARDEPLIIGIVAFISIIILIFNLLVDIAYGFIDPRIRY